VITPQRWYQIERIAWLPDGSGLLMTASEQAAEASAQQVWHVAYPSGETTRITNDLNNYGSISVSSDSSVLVTVQNDRTSAIWVSPAGDTSKATEVPMAASKLEGALGLSWMPDGRILFRSMTGGSEGIWVMDADGKNRHNLTRPDTVDAYPSASPDGRYIVFMSERSGIKNIWRMNADGSDPRQLTKAFGNLPEVTPDGRWVTYQARGTVWKVSIDGGEPIKVSPDGMVSATTSPDGKLIACTVFRTGAHPSIGLLDPQTGTIQKSLEAALNLPPLIRWSPDGNSLAYISKQNGLADIWSQPVGGGEPKRLTNFKAGEIFYFDWSGDNKLLISLGNSTKDVVLIRNMNK
jgi:Tol biopolymer transport system component